MNISIDKLVNGWILTVRSPKGQMAVFYATFKELRTALEELEKEMNTPAQPVPDNVVDMNKK
jgi:hypothetical protein